MFRRGKGGLRVERAGMELAVTVFKKPSLDKKSELINQLKNPELITNLSWMNIIY